MSEKMFKCLSYYVDVESNNMAYITHMYTQRVSYSSH